MQPRFKVAIRRNTKAIYMSNLSVIIPCFNERTTIQEILRRVLSVELEAIDLEVVIIDDGSTDGSAKVIAMTAQAEPRIRVITHPRNRGKGAALRSAQSVCTGDYVVIQDADLEYDPQNYASLLAPLLEGQADAVYGSRFAGGRTRRVLLYSHEVGNRFLTAFSNIATDFNLTDMSTGAKIFRGDLFRSIPICCDGFGFEPEITAKQVVRGADRLSRPLLSRRQESAVERRPSDGDGDHPLPVQRRSEGSRRRPRDPAKHALGLPL
jgi:glycosyltransferase involved in cell wall biosynthesis